MHLLIDKDMFSQLFTKLKTLILYPSNVRMVTRYHLLAEMVQAKVPHTMYQNIRAQINMCGIPNTKLD